MMQWKIGDAGFEMKDEDAGNSAVVEHQSAPGALVDHVVASLAATLARVGVTSVVVALVVALLIATVLFGLSTQETMATGNWCSRC